jgi:hypothetical protein
MVASRGGGDQGMVAVNLILGSIYLLAFLHVARARIAHR